jgi:hypothetical protein
MKYYTSYYVKACKVKTFIAKKMKKDLEKLGYEVLEGSDEKFYYLLLKQVNDYTYTIHNYFDKVFKEDEYGDYEDIGVLRTGENVVGDYDYYGDYSAVNLRVVQQVEGFPTDNLNKG